jgi:aspartokinase
MDKVKIGGIMESEGRALLTIRAVPPSPQGVGALLAALGEAGVNIELMAESRDGDHASYITLVVDQNDLDRALSLLEETRSLLPAHGVSFHREVAVISVFGPHLREKPRVPGLMFSALAQAGIQPLAVATSISSLSAVVEASCRQAALEALQAVFDVPFSVRRRPKEY